MFAIWEIQETVWGNLLFGKCFFFCVMCMCMCMCALHARFLFSKTSCEAQKCKLKIIHVQIRLHSTFKRLKTDSLSHQKRFLLLQNYFSPKLSLIDFIFCWLVTSLFFFIDSYHFRSPKVADLPTSITHLTTAVSKWRIPPWR